MDDNMEYELAARRIALEEAVRLAGFEVGVRSVAADEVTKTAERFYGFMRDREPANT